MNKAAITVMGIAALLLTIAPATTFATSPYVSEIVWGNNISWQMYTPPGHGTGNPSALEPLYIVAPQTGTPQSPSSNDHIPGVAHDHVLAPPPANKGDYNPNWEVYLVGCASGCTSVIVDLTSVGGPSSFPLALSYNGAPLTSDAAIGAGVASHSLFLVDTGIHFICLVKTIK